MSASTGQFQVTFPIDDMERPQGQLKDEARERTRRAADDAGLTRTGPVSVQLEHGTGLLQTTVDVKWLGPQPVVSGYVD